jgi:hypothetical protein
MDQWDIGADARRRGQLEHLRKSKPLICGILVKLGQLEQYSSFKPSMHDILVR